MAKIQITGLDKLVSKLEEIKTNAKDLSGYYSFEELFPESFINQYCRFKSIKAFIDASGIKVNSSNDLENNTQWDIFVAENSDFSNWKEMRNMAVKELAIRKLES